MIRIPPDIHDALTRLRTERHVNTSAWVRATIKSALEGEGVLSDTTAPTVAATAGPLPGWCPHHLKTGAWGSIYLGDTSILPPELVGAGFTVQSAEVPQALPHPFDGLVDAVFLGLVGILGLGVVQPRTVEAR